MGLAALADSAVPPSELADASFLLSFLAVGTIAGIAVAVARTAPPSPIVRALDHLGDVTRDGAHPPRAAQFRLDCARRRRNWLAAHLPAAVSRLASTPGDGPLPRGLRLWELIVISAALQIGMLPLMAQYFHRISLVGSAGQSSRRAA